MYEYDEECLQTFLNMQSQLFDEPVAETLEEAEAFLEDCMAVVVDSIKDVRDYLDESGADISGMSDEELEEASEVFALGRLIKGKELRHQLVAAAFLSASRMVLRRS